MIYLSDHDSICAVEIKDEDPKKKTATVHIFKNELEGKIQTSFRELEFFTDKNHNIFLERQRRYIRETIIKFRTQKYACN